jgi:hypothetical protein
MTRPARIAVIHYRATRTGHGFLSPTVVRRRYLYPAIAAAKIGRVGPTLEKRTFHTSDVRSRSAPSKSMLRPPVQFALLEAAVKLRKRSWQGREVPLEPETWSLFASGGLEPTAEAEQSELLATVQQGIEEVLTPHQRRILVALALNGVPIDVLAERLETTRGALYTTLHDARRKLPGSSAPLSRRSAARCASRSSTVTSSSSSPGRTSTPRSRACARTSTGAPPAAGSTRGCERSSAARRPLTGRRKKLRRGQGWTSAHA